MDFMNATFSAEPAEAITFIPACFASWMTILHRKNTHLVQHGDEG
jgi:hypothetical protein